MHPPTVTRIRLPLAPESPARTGLPWAAIVAPVLVSVGLWVFTGSMFGLLFAALGPVVAIAGLLDGARSRRRSGRRARRTFASACERVGDEIAAAHALERARLAAECPRPSDPAWDGGSDSLPVLVGSGRGTSAVELTGEEPEQPEPVVAEAFARLRRAASEPPAGPVVLAAASGLGVVGPPVLAAAVARAAAVQVAASLSPATTEVRAPAGESWTEVLPHPSRSGDGSRGRNEAEYRWYAGAEEVVIAWAVAPELLPAGCGTVVLVDELRCPHAVTSAGAERAAQLLAERATALGVRAASTVLPGRVELGALLDGVAPNPGRPGLAAAIGHDGAAPVTLDLVSQGPHALVSGTTGSGKSELLVSWVLAMSDGRSPDTVSFLLIDFKGGAAFSPLAGLPHVIATLSDLDARLTRRAVQSLRAELLRRERQLAAAGVRSIDELPAGAMARLVIVVDEFAALVASGPELQDVFADLAARGRSLGLHLVLCTQRPAGVVRDAVLANIGLRVSLRVTDRADSIAMLGDDAAARLPADPRGRAIVLHDGASRSLQVALATPQDTERIAGRAPRRAAPGAPWCDPLPPRLDLDALPAADGGLVFGLLDLPAEQRQPVAVYRAAHGSLLVVGAAGSGVTTALTTIAESARRDGLEVAVLPGDPADAWQMLADPPDAGVLIIDDLDLLLDRFEAGHRHEFADALGAVLRQGSPRVVAGARRIDGEVARPARAFGSRLVLRQATREDQLLAGADAEQFDPARPPGNGSWQGVEVQVAIVRGGTLPDARLPVVPEVSRVAHPRVAVVSARPRADADLIRAAGWRAVPVGPDAMVAAEAVRASGEPVALLGDPDAWNADWGLLTAARREWPIVMHGCSPADHRALLPGRGLPPPLSEDPAECWLSGESGTVRARIVDASARRFAHESVARDRSDH